MTIVKNTLEENYIFFLRELSRIEHELGKLPRGNISAKKIGGLLTIIISGEKAKGLSLF